MTVRAQPPARRARLGRRAQQELRDLWLGGRGLVLSFAFSLLLSVIAYLVATNRALNFLEQRETVNLTLQVAIAVGALLDAARRRRRRQRRARARDAREPAADAGARGSRSPLGKLLAALSLWLAAFVITVPYVWFLGRGVGDRRRRGRRPARSSGRCSRSPRVVRRPDQRLRRPRTGSASRSSLFVLLALFVPTQLPSSAQKGWAGDLLLRLDPITAGRALRRQDRRRRPRLERGRLVAALAARRRRRPRRAPRSSRAHGSPPARGWRG